MKSLLWHLWQATKLIGGTVLIVLAFILLCYAAAAVPWDK